MSVIRGVTVNHLSYVKLFLMRFLCVYAALLKHLKLLKWIGPRLRKVTF